MAFNIRNSSASNIAFDRGWVRFTRSVNRRDQLRFRVTQAAGSALPFDVGDDVYVHDGSSNIFGGTVDEIDEIDVTMTSQTYRRAKFTAVSFDELVGRRLVAESYTSQTCAAIISDLISNYFTNEGITAGTIETGPTLTKVVFNYLSGDRCLDELAELAGFSWWVDAAKQLHFRARTSVTAPWALSSGNKDYLSINVIRNRARYRNVQYLRAGIDLTDSAAETLVGDGTRKTFNVSLPIGAEPTIEVNTGGGYTTKTVGVNGVDTGKDWYYNIGRTEVTQASGGTTLTSSHTVKVTYQGQIPIIALAEDTDEIAARAAAEDGSASGRYEAINDDPNIDDADLAEDKAAAMLSRYGTIPVRIHFETDTAGIAAGQLMSIVLSDHGLNDDYLIESVVATDRDDGELRYQVTAVGNDSDGGWIAYFKALANSNRKFVIRENETLLVIRTPADGVAIADAPSSSTSTSSGTTIDNAAAIVGLIDVG